MKCPKCDAENKDDAKFCKNCGEKLESVTSQINVSKPETNKGTMLSRSQSTESKPKSNKNILIICVTAIICVAIVAGAFIFINNGFNGSNSSVVDTLSDSTGYYQYEFEGYTFNIPSDYKSIGEDYDSETQFWDVGFEKDDSNLIYISVSKDVPNLNKKTAKNMTGERNGDVVLVDETFANVSGWGDDIAESNFTGHMFGFISGDDIILILSGRNVDLNKILENINQEPLPDAPSSSSTTTKTMSYAEAASYLSGASDTIIQNTFDEADANGDGVLKGSEITEFKRLADLTDRTADKSNTENVEAQDQGAGDGTTKTRYCTTHGRVAVGDDNRCPYCEAEGLDSRTVKGSTEYI